jgi:hypothetical protein
LHNSQLVSTAGLESTRIVENITLMIGENEFVLDVVLATLHKQINDDQPSLTRTSLSNLHSRPEFMMLAR